MDKVPPHIFASGQDIVRVLTALERMEWKLNKVLGLEHFIANKEIAEMATVAEIKQEVIDLVAEVAKEKDGEVAVKKAFDGLTAQISDLTGQLRTAINNGANPQDLNDVAAGLSAVLSAVKDHELADAAIAGTQIDPNPPTPTTTLPPVTALSPSVSSIAPTSGSAVGGDTVTISGSGFTGASAVNFGAASANFFVVDDTTINAVSPSGTSGVSVAVSVTGPTGTSTETPQFSYA